eukprot:266497_1
MSSIANDSFSNKELLRYLFKVPLLNTISCIPGDLVLYPFLRHSNILRSRKTILELRKDGRLKPVDISIDPKHFTNPELFGYYTSKITLFSPFIFETCHWYPQLMVSLMIRLKELYLNPKQPIYVPLFVTALATTSSLWLKKYERSIGIRPLSNIRNNLLYQMFYGITIYIIQYSVSLYNKTLYDSGSNFTKILVDKIINQILGLILYAADTVRCRQILTNESFIDSLKNIIRNYGVLSLWDGYSYYLFSWICGESFRNAVYRNFVVKAIQKLNI